MIRPAIRRYSLKNGLAWLLVFVFLTLIPIGIAYSWKLPDYRTFLEEFGVSLGFFGLSLFAIQFVFSGRIRQVAPAFGVDNIVQFHKEMGVIALVFSLAHPILMLIADSGYLSFFDPSVNLLRALALITGSIGMVLLLVTSLWRLSFGMSYEVWRLVHGLLGSAVLFIGVTHAIQVGYYLNDWVKVVLFILFFLLCIYTVVHSRLVRPYINRKSPFVIEEVLPERDDCYTLVLANKGNKDMVYEPGQFAWMTANHTPFSLQQHPFSFSSSTEEELISITAKRLGDFTNRWKYFQPGQMVFLEGPYGSFTLKEKPCFLIMGGIGVTPAISILKTLRDRKDERQCILLYGNESWSKVPFREELQRLENEINLTVVYVLQEGDGDAKTEKGMMEADLIKKYLPENRDDFDYYICGPEPMMDIAEITLRQVGISWQQIYAERFDLA